MESRDVSILKLLETLQNNPTQSQRELSKFIGLSLGMVNKLINEMISQGLLKSDKIVRNKSRYLLTSNGMTAKMVLTRNLLSHYRDCLNKLKQIVKEGLEQIKGAPEKSIVLYGACDLCEIASILSGQLDHKQIIIIDDQKAGTTIGDFSVFQEAEIELMDYDAILIMETENMNEARMNLIGKGVPSEKIFHIMGQGNIDNSYN